MSRHTEPQKELPSTYPIQNRSSQEDTDRLEIQDKMLTSGMGGLLPEMTDPTMLRRVLDVGCGTGVWLREMARTYPQIETLVGVDISNKVLAYGRAQAEAQQLDGRLQFRMMDALRRLEFPAASFDLVNQRSGASWLRTWDWTKIFLEYLRVTRPGGIIRITEGTIWFECNSPAMTRLNTILLEASYHSGRLFTASSDGLICELERLMTQHAVQEVQTQVHTVVYRAGTEIGQYFYEDVLHAFRLLLPFLQKWMNVPSNYQEIYEEALKEMQQPDFSATSTLLTAWGIRPRDGRPIFSRGLL